MDMASFSSSPTSPLTRARLLPRPAVAARDALYLVAGLPAGLVTFSVLVTGLSLGAGLLITLLGIPVVVATLYAARVMGDVERHRAGWVLDAPVRRTQRPWRGGAWARCKAALTDVGAWRDVVWGLVLMPLGTLGFSVAVTVWSTALGMVSSPLWYWALPDNDDQPDWALDALNSHSVAASAARLAVGLLLIPVAAWTCRGLADLTARGARAMLEH
jgi:hypothetical protein